MLVKYVAIFYYHNTFTVMFSLLLSCLIDGYTGSKLLSYCTMCSYMAMCIVIHMYVMCKQIVFIINAM